jgi:hypothetical protein
MDYLEDAKTIFSDPEIKEAGITDAIEFLHEDLTVEEIREYIRFGRAEFGSKLREIKKLRKERPEKAWQMMKSGFGRSLPEYRMLKEMHEQLVIIWKKCRPKISNRDIETKGPKKNKDHKKKEDD